MRFRDDTAADIASSRTNAASPIARVTRSREARVTDLPDKTPRLRSAAVRGDARRVRPPLDRLVRFYKLLRFIILLLADLIVVSLRADECRIGISERANQKEF